MLDHVGFGVSDYARSKEFYEQALGVNPNLEGVRNAVSHSGPDA